MVKKWVFPLLVILIPIAGIIVLAAFLNLEIGWATAPIAATGMFLFLYFDAAPRPGRGLELVKRNIAFTNNLTLLKFIGLVFVFIIGGYLLGVTRDEEIALASIIFITFSLVAYVLLYAIFVRYFIGNGSLVEEASNSPN